MGYRMINGRAYPVGDIGGFQQQTNISKVNNDNSKASFKDVLQKSIEEKNSFTISKHAAERLKEIDFNETDMENIEKGFEIAEEKGSKNSLMLYKNVALVTSIENRTLITAIENDRAKENIYTNIDSVVIL
jgi:flagellar operon protein